MSAKLIVLLLTLVVVPLTVMLPAITTPVDVTVNAVEPSTVTVTVPVPLSTTETFELPCVILLVLRALMLESTYSFVAASVFAVGTPKPITLLPFNSTSSPN